MPIENNIQKTKINNEDMFERGFKAWCENTSGNIRKRLGLDQTDPLPADQLAEKLGVTLWDLEQVPNLKEETLKYLSSAEGNEWSAVTINIEDETVVIVNSAHSSARKSSSIMHELAHLIRGHAPDALHHNGNGLVLREFNDLQEAEATWFSAVLLLPRKALSYCAYKRIPKATVLEDYNVSEGLYRYRVNVTGVRKQFRRKY